MEFDHVVQKRKMIRKYLPNKIPDRIISKLIKNASKAPSAGHTQVQEFIIVRDPATKKKLRQASVNQKAIEDAPVLIVVCSNTSRSVGRYGQRGRDFYSIIDGAFADDKIAKILELPEYVKPIGIIAVGYPDESPAKLERIRNEQIVHYERW